MNRFSSIEIVSIDNNCFIPQIVPEEGCHLVRNITDHNVRPKGKYTGLYVQKYINDFLGANLT